MGEIILNKVLLIIFLMSVLNCLKHSWNIINSLREEVPNKYEVTRWDRFLLGLSISYIITIVFTGLQIQ
jgi:hypothetical protein